MEFKLDKGTGYMYCYSPSHLLANGAGKVIEHVLVATEKIGRRIHSYECVHHIDRNKTNNSPDNLQVMTNTEHRLLHLIEDEGYIPNFVTCETCTKVFKAYKSEERLYCSPNCSTKAQVRFEVTAEELEYLVWSMPATGVAEKFGVSDSAIAKRCKKLGISKPPRGYWAKNKPT